MPLALPLAEMEQARLARDPAYNGLFFTAVRTTGIFCRPTCTARPPLAKNVTYFPTADEALAAGFRPCKRCRPTAIDEQPAWATALIADLERSPQERMTEQTLADRGLDPATVRRHFLRTYGMTFQAFARARRLGESRIDLQTGAATVDAAFTGGYRSESGFRDAFARLFGESPASVPPAPNVIRLSWFASPVGPLVIGATHLGVCFLEYSDPARLEVQMQSLRKAFAAPVVPGRSDLLDLLQAEITAYFAGDLQMFTVPLDFRGTSFQEQVWRQLLQIPYGETRSYEELATAVGNPGAVRASGAANGRNRISIVIPCHRVVNKSGALGGYGGGLRRKEFLLAHEREHKSS